MHFNGQHQWIIPGVATGLTNVGETQALSGAAQAFIAEAGNAPDMNPIQMAFIASIILMQLLQVWVKKPD